MNLPQNTFSPPIQNWRERYQVVNQIDEGAFWQAYLAIRIADPDQYVSVKVANISKEQKLKLFESEAKCLRQIQLQRQRNLQNLQKDPQNLKELAKQQQLDHLLELIEIIQIPGSNEAAIIMKYYNGSISFSQLLSDNKNLNDAIKLKCFFHIALGLCFMHSINMYHRNLKPEHLLYIPERDSIVIRDFSYAVIGNTDNYYSEYIGTKMYQSPQQLRIEDSSFEKNDIWALGVILYMMLFNKHPLLGDSNSLDGLVSNASGLLSHNYKIDIPQNQPLIVKEILSKTLSGREILREKVTNIVHRLFFYFESNTRINRKNQQNNGFQFVQEHDENALATKMNQQNEESFYFPNTQSQNMNYQDSEKAEQLQINNNQSFLPTQYFQQQWNQSQQSCKGYHYHQEQIYQQIQPQQQLYSTQEILVLRPEVHQQEEQLQQEYVQLQQQQQLQLQETQQQYYFVPDQQHEIDFQQQPQQYNYPFPYYHTNSQIN